MTTTTSLRSTLSGNPCDEWWDTLSSEQRGALWILMRMVSEMKLGGAIELIRGEAGISANVLDQVRRRER